MVMLMVALLMKFLDGRGVICNCRCHLWSVSHFQNGLLHTNWFLFLFLTASSSQTVVETNREQSAFQRGSQQWSWCSWVVVEGGRHQSVIGFGVLVEKYKQVWFVALWVAYRCHAEGVVGVWFEIIKGDHFLFYSSSSSHLTQSSDYTAPGCTSCCMALESGSEGTQRRENTCCSLMLGLNALSDEEDVVGWWYGPMWSNMSGPMPEESGSGGRDVIPGISTPFRHTEERI